ncbi:hypothetical protein RRG08_026235 [Elysia crispata]|uniref:EGF-like domain-containing protein n=1 Tax=Elysia crispata TaxID=231223 RepID=A0AAE1DCL6_9GAST|nr:hypothetical protein RRG08_026235 [Elysia crispata]
MNLSSQLKVRESPDTKQMDLHSFQQNPEISNRTTLAFIEPSILSTQTTFTDGFNGSISSESGIRHSSSEQCTSSSPSPALSRPSLDPSIISSSKPFQVKSQTLSLSISSFSQDNYTARPSCSPSVSKAVTSFMHVCFLLSDKLFEKFGTSLSFKPFPIFPGFSSSISLPRPSKIVLVSVLFLVILSLQAEQSAARSVGVCRGIPCANGGRLLVSNSIWGNCRCRCPSGFVGPYCQYQAAYKRSGDSTASSGQSQQGGRRVNRTQTMESIRQHLLALAAMPPPSSSEDTAGLSNTDDGGSDEIIINNISRRDADIGLLALSRLSDFSSTDLLDGRHHGTRDNAHCMNLRFLRCRPTASRDVYKPFRC